MLATALSATLVGLQAHLVRVEVEGRRGAAVLRARRPRRGGGPREPRAREERARAGRRLPRRVPGRRQPRPGRREEDRQRVRPRASRRPRRGALGMRPARGARGGALRRRALARGHGAAAARRASAAPRRARARRPARHRPARQRGRGALVEGIEVRTVGLARRAARGPPRRRRASPRPTGPRELPDAPRRSTTWRDVRGQAGARRALEIAAAGGHNLLMIGPPGRGQDDARAPPARASCRRCRPTEALEVTAIHSVAGLLSRHAASSRARPFRAPHHTVSEVGLVGGGRRAAARAR